jgi:hypothetical protein
VRGAAAEDADFAGGGDRIVYEAALGGAQGPFTVTAELWYQPVGYRWAHNLEAQESAESKHFVAAYNAVSRSSAAILAKATAVATAHGRAAGEPARQPPTDLNSRGRPGLRPPCSGLRDGVLPGEPHQAPQETIRGIFLGK